MRQPESILKLQNKFAKLPGVGAKTALRYAYSIIDMDESTAEEFADAIIEVKQKIHLCSVCGVFTQKDVCDICASRDNSVICVVAYPKDVLSIEKASTYKGVYHVLHGTLSPLDGRGPNEIKVKELLKRLDGVEEVILATNPDVEGEATAMYIAKLIKPMNIRCTRLAQGISMGSDIEYADEITLSRALELRTDI